MNLNEFSQAKSEFSHVVRMVRNHIAEEHFVSKIIFSVRNLHDRLGVAMDNFNVKCQIWRHASSPCFKAVGASPKLYSITHKSMCGGNLISWYDCDIHHITEPHFTTSYITEYLLIWLWPAPTHRYPLSWLLSLNISWYDCDLQPLTDIPYHGYFTEYLLIWLWPAPTPRYPLSWLLHWISPDMTVTCNQSQIFPIMATFTKIDSDWLLHYHYYRSIALYS